MNMNIEAIKQIQRDIFNLKEVDEEMSKTIEGLKIDKQLYLRANEKIKPGIACKIAYDENGLVISAEDLDQSDIPKLSIDKIQGLRDALADKASRKDLKNISIDLEEIFKERDIYGTGCKVNYDKYGVIQSSTELVPEDIPILGLDHIQGLSEQLESIRSSIPKDIRTVDQPNVSPGTGVKVTYDEHGHITGTSNIDMNDIPMEIITRLNEIESMIPLLASSKTLEAINKTLSKKANKGGNISPGTYTKVTVNKDGVIDEASKLTVNDLPELNIENINGLYKALREKAEHSDVTELMTSVSILMTYMNKIGDLSVIKNKVDRMVTESTISGLSAELDGIKKSVASITSVDINMIMTQLEDINKQLSNLTGRITVLEQRLQN